MEGFTLHELGVTSGSIEEQLIVLCALVFLESMMRRYLVVGVVSVFKSMFMSVNVEVNFVVNEYR